MYINKVVICGVDTSKLPVLKEKEKEARRMISQYLDETFICYSAETINNTLKEKHKNILSFVWLFPIIVYFCNPIGINIQR